MESDSEMAEVEYLEEGNFETHRKKEKYSFATES